MKAIVVMGQAAGTVGMKLVVRPEPQAATINDIVVGAIEGAFPNRCWVAIPFLHLTPNFVVTTPERSAPLVAH